MWSARCAALPMGGQRHDPQLSPLARPTTPCLLLTPGAAAQRTKPSGPSDGLAGAMERFLLPSSLHTAGGTERESHPGERGGPGKGGSGTACASRQDAGRRGKLRTGFLWGKGALSPCVDSPKHRQAPRGQDVKGRPQQGPPLSQPVRNPALLQPPYPRDGLHGKGEGGSSRALNRVPQLPRDPLGRAPLPIGGAGARDVLRVGRGWWLELRVDLMAVGPGTGALSSPWGERLLSYVETVRSSGLLLSEVGRWPCASVESFPVAQLRSLRRSVRGGPAVWVMTGRSSSLGHNCRSLPRQNCRGQEVFYIEKQNRLRWEVAAV